jgi:hypothetical protein
MWGKYNFGNILAKNAIKIRFSEKVVFFAKKKLEKFSFLQKNNLSF